MTAENIAAVRSQKLWAVLLVLDSFFVIIFGGALAAKIYQHWQTPALPPPSAHRKARAPAKAPETAKPPEPAPQAAAKPTAEIPEKTKTAAAGIAPARPSLLQEAPRRENAQPQELDKPPKATPVEFKLKNSNADTVEIGGAFLVRGGGKKRMIKHDDGVWTITLYLTPNTYRYYFLVDGKKTLDPQNTNTDRNASVIVVSK